MIKVPESAPRRPRRRKYGSRRDPGRGGLAAPKGDVTPAQDGPEVPQFPAGEAVIAQPVPETPTVPVPEKKKKKAARSSRQGGKAKASAASTAAVESVDASKPETLVEPPTEVKQPLIDARVDETATDRPTPPTRRRVRRADLHPRPEPVKAQPRPKRRRTMIVLLVVFALLGAGLAASLKLLPDLWQSAADYPGPGDGEVKVVINDNDTGVAIGNELYNKEVVASVKAFTKAFSANSQATSIQPGTYKLKKHMKAADALAALLDRAASADMQVTVPEGFTKTQVAQRIAKAGNFPLVDVQNAMKDAKGIGLPAQANGNVEGWLAPGQYRMKPGDGPKVILSEMVERNRQRLVKLDVPADKQARVLIVGSILEREVNKVEYLPMVARVIDNRLADVNGPAQGRLNMDSTVLYGVGKTSGLPTKDDLASGSPYNTYKVKGLPPSPIGAVGDDAISAVLNPAPGPWLYFTTINLDTGETLFVKTMEEQKVNIGKLKAWCDAHPGKC